MEFIDDKVREVLEKLPNECAYIDYKVEPYFKKDDPEFVKDIISMLNSIEEKGNDKFIIMGVSDERKKVGIEDILTNSQEKFDDANYQSRLDWISPRPRVSFGTIEFDGHTFGYAFIKDSLNQEKIYELNCTVYNKSCINGNELKNHIYKKGMAFSRRGSQNYIMMQPDRDELLNYRYSKFGEYKPDLKSYSADNSSTNDFITALMLGSWNEENVEDITLIESLSKKGYDDWIKSIRDFSNAYPDDIVFKNPIWIIKNRVALLKQFSGTIYKDSVVKFKNVLFERISNYNKKYDLTEKERWAYLVHNTEQFCSNEIISGMINFFAMISNDHSLLVNVSDNSIDIIAFEFTKSVMLCDNWKIFATIKENLNVFSEIDPDTFIKYVEESLKNSQSSLVEFVNQKETVTYDSYYASDLVYALKVLACKQEYFASSCYCLFLLSEYYKDCILTLTSILLSWYPLTEASSAERIAFVSQIANFNNDNAWNLVYSLLPNITTIGGQCTSPKYLQCEIEKPEKIPSTYCDEVYAYLNIAINMSYGHVNRAVKLLHFLDSVNDETIGCILELVRSFENEKDEIKYIIWIELSDILDKKQDSKYFNIANNALDSVEPASCVQKAKRYFRHEMEWHFPKDKVKKEVWKETLFDLRYNALKTCFDLGGFDMVELALPELESSSSVADCLIKLDLLSLCDNKVCDWLMSNTNLNSIAKAYIGRSYSERGIDWVRAVLRNKNDKTVSCFLNSLFLNSEIISLANELLGKEGVSIFWQDVDIWNVIDCEDYKSVIQNLLKYNNPEPALNLLNHQIISKQKPDPEIVFESIMAFSNVKVIKNIDGYHLVTLIEFLENEWDNKEKIVELEVFWARVLVAHDKTPQILFDEMSSSPELFVHCLKKAYKERSKESRNLNEQEKAEAMTFYEILYAWHQVPGYKSGILDEEKLLNWVNEVKKLAKECDRYEVALSCIGKMLYHAPKDSSGLFINKQAAHILHSEEYDEIRNGYSCEVTNSRGVHNIDPTGAPEFELERIYNERAKEISELGYFRFAKTLRDIANNYHREALSNIKYSENLYSDE